MVDWQEWHYRVDEGGLGRCETTEVMQERKPRRRTDGQRTGSESVKRNNEGLD